MVEEQGKVTSSVEIERNSRGYSYHVKTYALDNTAGALGAAVKLAKMVELDLAATYGPRKEDRPDTG